MQKCIMKTYLKVSTYRLLLILLLRLHVIVLSLLISIIIRYDYWLFGADIFRFCILHTVCASLLHCFTSNGKSWR